MERESLLSNRSHQVLGVPVHALSRSALSAVIADAVETDACKIVGSLNLHSMYVYHHDARMQQFFDRADYIHIDGMGVVMLGKLLGVPLERQHRVTYMSSFPSLVEEWAKNGWRVFYLGSKPGIADRGAEILRQQFPQLSIQVADGYFDTVSTSADNRAVLAAISLFKPHVLLVGMGVPRQEHWILENIDKISANAILTTGATMDYVVGILPRQPEWAGSLCLQWLFRLWAEPRRKWKRYLVEPWFLAKLALVELWQSLRG